MESMRNGELTLEQYRAAFQGAVASRDSLHAELSAMTKKQIGDSRGGNPTLIMEVSLSIDAVVQAPTRNNSDECRST
jgi:hypothetical protein